MVAQVQEKIQLQELLRRHPADIAEVLTTLKEAEAVELLRRLYLRRAAAAPLGEMDPEEAARLLAELNREEAIHILSHMDPDDAVDLLLELPEATVRELLSRLEARKAQMFRALLAYPADTAGGLMSPEVLALPAHLTAQQAIEEIRRRAEELETVYYAYVLDEEKKLSGVLSLRDLVLARPETLISAIMNREVVTLPPEMDVEEVAQLFDKYNYLALPVVDKEGHLLGVVTVDDVMDVMREEATEDLLRLGGIPSGEEAALSPPLTSVRFRLPWMMGYVLLDLLVVYVVSRFEGTIAQAAALAAFMPLIADMSGNVAAQALSVAIRGMATGEVGWRDLPRMVRKEILVGCLNGLVLGAQLGLIALLLRGNPFLGLVAAVALAGNTLVATVTGGILPFLLKRIKVDPAMVSGPVATTLADLTGFFLFLGLGTVFLPYLR